MCCKLTFQFSPCVLSLVLSHSLPPSDLFVLYSYRMLKCWLTMDFFIWDTKNDLPGRMTAQTTRASSNGVGCDDGWIQ